MMEEHSKVLTKNDTGETGGHQGGIAVPKTNSALIQFFPKLCKEEFNPEEWIFCEDPDGELWKMRYVYYNGKTFSPRKSTRNEYRITYMTKFFAKWDAVAEDSVTFSKTEKAGYYKICIDKSRRIEPTQNNASGKNKLIVLRGWSRVF